MSVRHAASTDDIVPEADRPRGGGRVSDLTAWIETPLRLDADGVWLHLHFGMTGGLHVPRRPPLRLMSSRGAPAPGWPPRFA